MSYTVNDVMAELPLIADAIRSKEGTTEPIPFIDYKNRIAALKGEEVIDYSLLDTPPIDAEPLVAWTVDSYTAGDTVLKNNGTLDADIQLVGDTPVLTTNNNVDVLQLTNTCAYVTFPATNYATVFVVARTPVPNSWDTTTNFAVQLGGDTANHCIGLRENESSKTSVTYRNQAFTATAVAANDGLQVIAIRVGYMYKYVYTNGWELTNGSSVSDSYQIQGLYLNSAGFKYASAAGEAYTPNRGMQIREIYVFSGDYSTKIKDMTAWLLARTHQDSIFDEASEEETPSTPVIPDDPYNIVETKPLFWFDSSSVVDETTLTNKGTSTDVTNAVGLAVDETEDAISLASETGAFYTDFTAFSEATMYVVYKASALNAYYQAEKGCSLRAETKDCSVTFYCNETSSSKGTHNYISRAGKNDVTYYTDDSDYVTAATASKSTLHRAYYDAANIKMGDNNATYSFNRLAVNCQYSSDTPLTTIPKNSLLIKAILVYDEFHDSATVKRMTEWLNAKYRGL